MKEFMVVNIHQDRKNGQLVRYVEPVSGPLSEALITAHSWREVLTKLRESAPFTENYPQFAYIGTILERAGHQATTLNTSKPTIH